MSSPRFGAGLAGDVKLVELLPQGRSDVVIRRFLSALRRLLESEAGHDQTSEEKRVGLVWVAVSDADGTDAVEKRFNRDRNRIRFYASQQALDLVRRCLM